MRYRREDDDGDYTFGQGDDTWLVNSPRLSRRPLKRAFCFGTGSGSSIPRREPRGFSPFWVSKAGYLQPRYP